jgi:hypothetical protein
MKSSSNIEVTADENVKDKIQSMTAVLHNTERKHVMNKY